MTKSYNLAFLKDYFDDDESSMAKILQMYLQGTPEEISAIENSILNNDATSAKAATHKIKVNVAMLGIRDSSSFIKDMHLLHPMDSIPEVVRLQFQIFKEDVMAALREISADFFEAPLL